MKKYLALLTFLVGFQAQAGLITLGLSNTTVNSGETVTVSLMASAMDEFDLFSMNLNFDTSLFSYNPLALFSDLDFSGLLEVNQVASGIALNYLAFVPVMGDFMLATFELTAIADGTTAFSLNNIDFTAPGAPIPMDNVFGSSDIMASVGKVSAPGTMALLCVALAGIGFSRRQNKTQA